MKSNYPNLNFEDRLEILATLMFRGYYGLTYRFYNKFSLLEPSKIILDLIVLEL